MRRRTKRRAGKKIEIRVKIYVLWGEKKREKYKYEKVVKKSEPKRVTKSMARGPLNSPG